MHQRQYAQQGVFCNSKFPSFAKIFPQAPGGEFLWFPRNLFTKFSMAKSCFTHPVALTRE
jgi:hypothetical protein